MKIRRSTLLVPSNIPRFVEKARSLQVDAIMLDLQDAVTNTDRAKIAAREAAVQAIRQRGFRARELTVRVNGPGTPWFLDDVRAMVGAGVDTIVLTRTYGAEDVIFAEGAILNACMVSGRLVEVEIEVDTPATVVELEDVAKHARLITWLACTGGDFALDLGSTNLGPGQKFHDETIAYARGKILTIARAKGWNAGDSIRAAVPNDPESLREAIRHSRGRGFDGCLTTLPSQIDLVNECYSPSPEEVSWSKRIIAGYEEGLDADTGPVLVDGTLVFPLTYEYALRVRDFDAAIRGDDEILARLQSRGPGSTRYLAESPTGRSPGAWDDCLGV